MTTPSGQISAQDIKNEFGETGEGKVALGSYRVSQTKGELTLAIGDGVPTSGAISYDNMRNKKLNIVVDYYSGGTISRQDNGDGLLNAKTKYNDNNGVHVIGGLRSKPSNTSGHRVRIHVNKTLGGKGGGKNVCALRTGSWNSSTSLIVDVGGEGAIYGAGGDGGEGGNDLDAGNAGEDGASALGIEYNGTTVNVASGGLIRCGFGGGGGGGCGRQEDKNADRRACGGGGGGGQGFPGGAGGDRGRGGQTNGNDGTAGDISEAGEGGGGGNASNQAFGASGGEGGGQGEAADAGGSAQHGAGAGGGQGSAIRKASGVSFSLNNSGSVVGDTNQTGVS